jgi:hypothetical protein
MVSPDAEVKLSEQVNEVQSTCWWTDPVTKRPGWFACFLSGDGKAMQSAHHTRGAKCWSCALDVGDPVALQPQTGPSPGCTSVGVPGGERGGFPAGVRWSESAVQYKSGPGPGRGPGRS